LEHPPVVISCVLQSYTHARSAKEFRIVRTFGEVQIVHTRSVKEFRIVHTFGEVSSCAHTFGAGVLIVHARSFQPPRYIYQLDADFYDIVPASLSNTTMVMEGLWLFRRKATYYLFGSPLVGCVVPHPLGFSRKGQKNWVCIRLRV
jgi:hypothetical protein